MRRWSSSSRRLPLGVRADGRVAAPDCIHDALRDWRRACLEWVKEHPGQSLPFGEHGDVIDVLRADIAYAYRMPPCPKRFRPAQHNGVWLGPLPAQDCPHKPVV